MLAQDYIAMAKPKPIRLMQITHDLAIGGLQQVVVNLCRSIDRDRFHITVLCLRALGPLAEEVEKLGIKVLLLPQKKGTDYLAFLKIAKILSKEKIQVLHTHNTQPLIDGTLAALFSRGRKRIIHTDHAREFPDKRRYMFAEWCMSHFVCKMVGVSEQTTKNLRKYEKISSQKLTTIENGIDGSRFQIDVDKQSKRKELGIRLAGPIIGVISRIERVKGTSYLLKVMPEVVAEFPELTLLIVGDGSEKVNLEKEAQQLGISKHVIFTGSRSDIPEIFQVLELYLLPSLSEGLPMGVLEAMAAGCPVIASRVGGIPSATNNGELALLVEPGDLKDLLRAIRILLHNPVEAQERASKMKKAFEDKFSAALMSAKYTLLYGDE